jgi:hypothetical protein
MPSPLFWLVLLFFVILVWFDGVAAGRTVATISTDKPTIWKRVGHWLRRYFKNPTASTILGLFIVLLLLRLLIGLAPLLLFIIATWIWR